MFFNTRAAPSDKRSARSLVFNWTTLSPGESDSLAPSPHKWIDESRFVLSSPPLCASCLPFPPPYPPPPPPRGTRRDTLPLPPPPPSLPPAPFLPHSPVLGCAAPAAATPSCRLIRRDPPQVFPSPVFTHTVQFSHGFLGRGGGRGEGERGREDGVGERERERERARFLCKAWNKTVLLF